LVDVQRRARVERRGALDAHEQRRDDATPRPELPECLGGRLPGDVHTSDDGGVGLFVGGPHRIHARLRHPPSVDPVLLRAARRRAYACSTADATASPSRATMARSSSSLTTKGGESWRLVPRSARVSTPRSRAAWTTASARPGCAASRSWSSSIAPRSPAW